MFTEIEEALGSSIDGLDNLPGGLENKTWLVKRRCREPFVLRLSSRRCRSEILEELNFIEDCAAAGVLVGRPLPAFQGDFCLSTEFGTCTAFRYIQSSPAPMNGNEKFDLIVDQLGKLVRLEKKRPTFLQRRSLFPTVEERQSYVIRLAMEGKINSKTKDVAIKFWNDQSAGDFKKTAIHGDMHPGNIIWNGLGPHLIDFDDARNACLSEEILAFARGFCFVGPDLSLKRWENLRSSLRWTAGKESALTSVGLLATCISFGCAIEAAGSTSNHQREETIEVQRANRITATL